MDTIAYDYKGRSYIIKGDPKNRRLDNQDEKRREDEAERKRMQDPKYVKGKFEELLRHIESLH